jgi:hypothetical protein
MEADSIRQNGNLISFLSTKANHTVIINIVIGGSNPEC